jgi:IMP cyclohydrolase
MMIKMIMIMDYWITELDTPRFPSSASPHNVWLPYVSHLSLHTVAGILDPPHVKNFE